MRKIAHAILV